MDYLKISAEYSYPEELKSVDLHLSTNTDMSGAIVHGCSVEGKKISIELQGLQDGVQYYYCYEYDSGYSKEKSDKREIVIVITAEISKVKGDSSTSGGTVTASESIDKITTRGVCRSTLPNQTIDDAHTTDGSGTGSFTSQMTGLTGNTTCYVRAYATNEKCTVYGEEKSFTTLSTTGTINGYDWVDLGLQSGLKWATCNVGAEKPENCGNYFMWGETTPQDLSFITFIANKVELCSEISADPRCDAARFNWGGSWRLPSMEEFEELINECNWKWTIRGNSFGYKVTGGNGNHIFLPAAGYNIPTAQCFNDHSELFHLPKKNYRVMSYNHFNDNLGSYWTYSQKKGVS